MGVDAWVTVKYIVATPPVAPVAVTLYVPSGTWGTVKVIFAFWLVEVIVPTFVESKLTIIAAYAGKPISVAVTEVPAGPWKGLNNIEG